MIYIYLLLAFISFTVTFILTKLLIPRLKRVGMTGKDENKLNLPEIPEMGGLAVVGGFTAGLLLAIFLHSFFSFPLSLVPVLAALITIHFIAFIGAIDDLLNIPQWLKAFLPLFAATPLIAVQAAGSTAIFIPFIGSIDFGLFYTLLLVPLAVAVCSNLTNMLAGFNGLEMGMGVIIFFTLSLIAISNNITDMAVITIPMLAALLAFLIFNLYPAKIFPGDVGSLIIGVGVASAVIIGNLETVGVILMLPYAADFFIKLTNGLPHTKQEIRNGKLYPKDGKIKGLVHVVMKAFNGISEKELVLFFFAVESLFALIAFLLYFRL